MTTRASSLQTQVWEALGTVIDPELDEPVTDLGFVRSVAIDEGGVEVHLRLPTSFCSPNFAYLMASDAQDALARVPGIGRVSVLLDDHHDSDRINAGLAAHAGYVGTFGHEADTSLDELRAKFRRKAHTAAMERALMALLRARLRDVDDLPRIRLGDLPPGPSTDALLARRADIGLSTDSGDPVLVDDDGASIAADQAPLRLRRATSVRISMEGNSHFCRGLLATRYADGDAGGITTIITNTRSAS